MRLALAAVAALALTAGLEVTPGPPPPPSTLNGPLTVIGAVEMTTGPMAIDGGLSAQTVTVSGASAFSQPPTGLTRKGTLSRGASLALSIGCQTLGTVAVADTTADSACAVTNRPAALLNLGVVLDCYVTTPGTVTVRACALVALLSAPAGTYGVTLVGE